MKGMLENMKSYFPFFLLENVILFTGECENVC